MSFEPAGDFLLAAAQKYKLKDQAQGAMVCEQVRKFFTKKYPTQVSQWIPKKYVDQVLFIQAQNAAARSSLFMETHTILEQLQKIDIAAINEIRITK